MRLRFSTQHLWQTTHSTANAIRLPYSSSFPIAKRRCSGACDITTSPLVDLFHLSPETTTHPSFRADFQLFPNFLTLDEQRVLLSTSLKKLDEVVGLSREARKRRRIWQAELHSQNNSPTESVDALFPPEDTCTFNEAGHLLFSFLNSFPLILM